MKIAKLLTVCATFALSTSLAFANAANMSDYYSTIHPSTNTAINHLLHPPVDISVINATSDYIYLIVPNTSIVDYIAPGFNDHLRNYDPNIWSTYFILQDPYRNTFYSNTLCREAILTVYGYPGNYRENLDTELCN